MTRWRFLAFAGLIVIVVGVVFTRAHNSPPSPEVAARQARGGCTQAAGAFRRQESSVWITIGARVSRILPDEYGKYQHPRFIVQCPSGQTVLITNDVSVGSRVPVHRGDRVAARGEYIWNDRGGLIHFTHHGGPAGGGWILDGGKLYS